ncbi:MAG: acyl-CoA dehydrogenase family protein [Natrialbaceae archaeon]|nr:acyl-CoA dehydrogenase family protein [Natrialbaceae archaeon]
MTPVRLSTFLSAGVETPIRFTSGYKSLYHVRRKNGGMDFDLTEEQKQIRDEVRRFADNEIRPHAAEYDAEEKYPDDIVEKAAEHGTARRPHPRRVRRCWLLERSRRPSSSRSSSPPTRASRSVSSATSFGCEAIIELRHRGTERAIPRARRAGRGDYPGQPFPNQTRGRTSRRSRRGPRRTVTSG